MPWVSRAEYDRLLAAIDTAERRAADTEAALAAERAENRRTERWMTNMLMRRAGTYPVPAASPPVQGPPVPVELETIDGGSEIPGMDTAELEALVVAGSQYGQNRADVLAFLRRERGLE